MFVHKETGLEFPAVVGSFHRTSASLNRLTNSFIISYEQEERGRDGAAITIYLYDRPGNLDEQLSGLEDGLKQFHPGARLLVRKKSKVGGRNGRLVLYELPSSGSKLLAEGCIYNIGDQVLKLRMTGELSERQSLTAEVRKLLETVLK